MAFGRRLRSREITCEAAIADYLARIDKLEPSIGSFEHVAADSALVTARAPSLLALAQAIEAVVGVPPMPELARFELGNAA